MQSDKHK